MTESEARIEEATRKAKQHSGGLKVFSGNGNMALSLEIARHLGINLGKATVGRFADGEVNCVIQENVRGKDIDVVQPTCPPVNDNIMELLLMVWCRLFEELVQDGSRLSYRIMDMHAKIERCRYDVV